MTRSLGHISRRVGRSLAGVAIVAGSLVLASPAHACSCVEMDLPTRLPDADGAFVGTSVDRSEIGDGLVAFTFDVERVVKGDFGPRAIVRTNHTGGSCGLEFFGDRRTGLLLERDEDGVWGSNLCSMVEPSTLLAESRGHPPDPGVAPVSAGLGTTSKVAGIGVVVVLTLLAVGGFALLSLRRHRSGPEGSEVA